MRHEQLGGQWIDITGVPEGDYVVRVTINLAGIFDEGEDLYPNQTRLTFTYPIRATRSVASESRGGRVLIPCLCKSLRSSRPLHERNYLDGEARGAPRLSSSVRRPLF